MDATRGRTKPGWLTAVRAVAVAGLMVASTLVPGLPVGAVVGGERVVDPSLYPFIAFVQAPLPNQPGGAKRCSGTLIQPDWILTAAHCIPDRYPQDGLTVFVGRTNAGDASTGHRATSDRWVTHPSYTGQTEYDVALVHLSQPVPGVEPVPLANAAQFEALTRAPLMLVGYGRQNFDDPADNSLNHTRTVFDTNNSTVITTEPPRGENTGPLRGDSGGPLLARATNGRLVQLGVIQGATYEWELRWRQPRDFDKIHAANLSSTTLAPWISTILETKAFANVDPSGRVYYRSLDGHIHELLLRQGSGWFHSDISKVADAPEAESDPAAYATAQGVRVVYRGSDLRIHELWHQPNGLWHHEDLHELSGIDQWDARAVGVPSGYASPNPRVVYRGGDGHVHELFQRDGGKWVHVDLHDKAGIGDLSQARAEGNPSGYASPASRVVYRGADDRIHEFFQHPDPDGRWIHADLTDLAAGAGEARGNPMGYLSPSGARVVYRSAGRRPHVHELFQRPQDGTWVHNDLQLLARRGNVGDLRASGDPWGFADPLARVLFRDGDHQLYELRQEPNGDWIATNLRRDAGNPRGAEGRPSGYATPFFTHSRRVVYLDTRNNIRELFQGQGSWGQVNLTDLADAPPPNGDPVGVTVPRRPRPPIAT